MPESLGAMTNRAKRARFDPGTVKPTRLYGGNPERGPVTGRAERQAQRVWEENEREAERQEARGRKGQKASERQSDLLLERAADPELGPCPRCGKPEGKGSRRWRWPIPVVRAVRRVWLGHRARAQPGRGRKAVE